MSSAVPGAQSFQKRRERLLDMPAIDEDRVDERAAAHLVALLNQELQDFHLEPMSAELAGLGDDHVRAKALEVDRAQDRKIEPLGVHRQYIRRLVPLLPHDFVDVEERYLDHLLDAVV